MNQDQFNRLSQIATIALAARYHDLVTAVAGTTLGMPSASKPIATK